MKTIKERAREFVNPPCDRRCKSCDTVKMDCRFYNDLMSFIAGAESEHEELTRWHDPKEELPPQGKMVLLKVAFGCHYQLAERGDECWWSPMDDEWGIPDSRVIGWREIHE